MPRRFRGFFRTSRSTICFASPAVLVGSFRELNLPKLHGGFPGPGRRGDRPRFAQKIGAPLSIVDKRRTDMNVAEVIDVIAMLAGKPALILDDIIDTAEPLLGVKRSDLPLHKSRRHLLRLRSGRPRPCFRVRPWIELPNSRLEQVL